MVILHVAKIKNEFTTGVAVAVPQHITAQSKTEEAALLNINNEHIDGVEKQFTCRGEFSLEALPEPFCSPDLVVFHNTYYIEFVKISKILKRKNIPYVIVPHGTLVKKAQRKKWYKKVVANLLFFNSFFKGAAAIQFLAEREMNASKYRNKGFIGANGVVIPDIISKIKQRDEIKMVYIGRTEVHIKGLDMMIKAVRLNRGLFEDNNIHLYIYGPDYQGRHAQVMSLIEKNEVGDLVSLHDAVIGAKKQEVLLDTDVFIQTSRTEGMPMGILEALSYSIPCIVTQGTGLSGIISKYDAGWVTKTDTDGIVSAMQRAVADKGLWHAKSAQARKLTAENYAWDKTVKDAFEVYRRLI